MSTHNSFLNYCKLRTIGALATDHRFQLFHHCKAITNQLTNLHGVRHTIAQIETQIKSKPLSAKHIRAVIGDTKHNTLLDKILCYGVLSAWSRHVTFPRR